MIRNKKYQRIISFVSGFIVLAVLVQLAGSQRGNRIVFPELGEICKAFFRLLREEKTYIAIGVTFLHFAEVLVVSLLIGIIIGIAEGVSDNLRVGLIPFMVMIRSIPMIVLVILIMTVLPYPLVPFVAGTAVLIPLISEAVSQGCRSIEPELKDVYRLHSRLNIRVVLHVYIPLISGYIKQALFNAAGMGLKIIITAEYLVQTANSLGKAVYSSGYFLEYDEIYAYALIMILLVLAVTELPAWIYRKTESLHTGLEPTAKQNA